MPMSNSARTLIQLHELEQARQVYFDLLERSERNAMQRSAKHIVKGDTVILKGKSYRVTETVTHAKHIDITVQGQGKEFTLECKPNEKLEVQE